MKIRKVKRRYMIAGVTFLILAILLVYALLEVYLIDINKITLNNYVPDTFKGTRIVFVSDIHSNKIVSNNHIKNMVKKINELNPDIVLLGGDYIAKGKEHIETCFNELSKINAKVGKYGVLGNHDHYGYPELVRESMEKAGIKCLDNDSVWIQNGNDRIKIGGVGDLWLDKQIIENTIHDVTEEDFVMLLSHNPDYAEKLKTSKIDLMLSGHTHGGQVTLFGLYAPFLPTKYGQKYRQGLIETENTKVLVSKGIGCTGLPFRFFSRPEINVIELK